MVRISIAAALLLVAAVGRVEQARPGAPPPSTQRPAFDELARRAAEAREAGRLDDAIREYRQAVRLRPRWDEGWWYLATTLYEKGDDAGARDALTRFLALKPETGAAHALRGMCEFRLQRYDEALADLGKAQALGLAGNPELRRVAWYHSAILLLRRGQFELAVEPLTLLARSEPESPSLVDATGLLLLRLPYMPSEMPADKRELVTAAGRAGFSWLARAGAEASARFKALIERYPTVPFVHYAYGVFLLSIDSDAALAELEREIAINPYSAYPHLEIAFELLRRGAAAGARPSAEKAVAIAPDLFAAHTALGRVLVELGEIEAGIRALETAVRLAPESPEVHFALANGYARAGRREDAAREREIFQRLNRAKEPR